MSEQSARQYEFTASGFNLPPRVLMLGHYAAFTEFLEQAGYQAFELPWVRRLREPELPQRLIAGGHVASLHQSFAEGHGIRGALEQRALSSPQQSLSLLEGLQRAAGRKLPLVAHPNEQWLAGRPPRRSINYGWYRARQAFGDLLFQPTVELFKTWSIYSPTHPEITAQDLLDKQIAHYTAHNGFSGIALDLHHLTAERAGERLSLDWCERFAGQLAARGALGGTSEVQFSIRSDFGGMATTMRQIFDGGLADTVQGRVLQAITDSLPEGQVSQRLVVETGPAEYRGIASDYSAGNAQLVQILRAELAA